MTHPDQSQPSEFVAPRGPLPQAPDSSYRAPSVLEAIAAASPGFGSLHKESRNNYLNSTYLSLPGLLKAVKGPLLEQGLVVYSAVASSPNSVVLRTTIRFVETEKGAIYSDFPIVGSSLENPQRIAIAITLGTRYNLFALLAICPEDGDNDGNFQGGDSSASAKTAGGLAPPGLPLPGGGSLPTPAFPSLTIPAQPSPVLHSTF